MTAATPDIALGILGLLRRHGREDSEQTLGRIAPVNSLRWHVFTAGCLSAPVTGIASERQCSCCSAPRTGRSGFCALIDINLGGIGSWYDKLRVRRLANIRLAAIQHVQFEGYDFIL